MATTSSTTTGISAIGVTKIKNSLNSYVDRLQRAISISANTAQIEQAIKGSSSEASLRQMNRDITTELGRFLNVVKEYNTTLDNILASYKSSDTSNATFANVSRSINKQ